MKINYTNDRKVDCYIDWNELVSLYRGYFTEKLKFKTSHARGWYEQIKQGHNKRFLGSDSTEMLERISNGYVFPEVDLKNMPTVPYDKPRPRFTDDPEGEFDNDMFNNGETEYFLSKPKKRSVGGIRMKVQIGFIARVSDATINQYFVWIGQTLQAIQARGYDLELSVFNRNTRLYPQYRDSFQNIRISKFGEKIMPKDWSALFSPGGHRHFMWLFYQHVAEYENLEYASNLGASVGKGWKLEWDKENRTLIVHVNSAAGSFPTRQMTDELEAWKD